MSQITLSIPPELYNPNGTMTDKTLQLIKAHMKMFPLGPCCKSDNRNIVIDSRIMVASYSSGTVERDGKTALLMDGDRSACKLFISQYCTNCGLTWFHDLNSVIGGFG